MRQLQSLEFDVLIIGSGVAGLASAIKLSESGFKVAIVTREKDPKMSNTYYAQGGIIKQSENYQQFLEDIQRASSATSNAKAVEVLGNRSFSILQELLLEKAHTDFETDDLGNLKLTKEAAHSEARILYKGDYTGKEIQISLLNYLNNKTRFPKVHFLTEHTAIDLITPRHHGLEIVQRSENEKVVGAYLLNQKEGSVYKVSAKFTILATGGISALYLHHTNSEGARGDGIAMAKRAGAVVTNMEFIQFHPTALYVHGSHRRFLISEALRGEGARLLNSDHEPFMQNYHQDKELAPRDVVSRAIVQEMIRTKQECVYLDISFHESEWIKNRFPTIYKKCLEFNIDITKEPIPVVPAAHYTCGGVKTNLEGCTSIENLYAVGEVACNGLHGANRLASTSLLEGLTWGYIAAENISKQIDSTDYYPFQKIKDWDLADGESDQALIFQDYGMIKQTMWNYVGLTRSPNRLRRARAMFGELAREVQSFYKNAQLSDELIGLRNAVEVCEIVVNDSMRNKSSVGCFYLNLDA